MCLNLDRSFLMSLDPLDLNHIYTPMSEQAKSLNKTKSEKGKSNQRNKK